MYAILQKMKAQGGPNQVVAAFANTRRDVWEAKVHERFQGSPEFVFRIAAGAVI
jgi:hypothetical protein